MKNIKQRNNFIIYVLLVVLLIAGVGYGLGDECQVFSSLREQQESRIFIPTISANDNIHTFQVRERSSVGLRYVSSRNNRVEAGLRGTLAFLCVLAILSVLFRLIQEVYLHFKRLYVHDWFWIIYFMHDTDGRKRFS